MAGEGGWVGIDERGAGLRVVKGDHFPRSSFKSPGLRGWGEGWCSSGPSARGCPPLEGGEGERGIFASFPSGWGDCRKRMIEEGFINNIQVNFSPVCPPRT